MQENLRGGQIADHFSELGACEAAMEWLWEEMPPTLRDAIKACDVIGWLLWAAAQSPLFTDAEEAIHTACSNASDQYALLNADRTLEHAEYVRRKDAVTLTRMEAVKTAMLACIVED